MAASAAEVQRGGDLIAYTEPYAAGNVMPTDSAWGTAFGGSWGDEGYSDNGLDVEINYTYDPQHVDQSIWPIFTVVTGGEVHFKTSLLQTPPQRIARMIGQGTISTVAAISGTRGHTDLLLDGTLTVTRLTGAFDVKGRSDSEPIRPVVWNAQAVGSQALKYARTAAAALVMDLQAYPDDANSGRVATIRDVSAALP